MHALDGLTRRSLVMHSCKKGQVTPYRNNEKDTELSGIGKKCKKKKQEKKKGNAKPSREADDKRWEEGKGKDEKKTHQQGLQNPAQWHRDPRHTDLTKVLNAMPPPKRKVELKYRTQLGITSQLNSNKPELNTNTTAHTINCKSKRIEQYLRQRLKSKTKQTNREREKKQ